MKLEIKVLRYKRGEHPRAAVQVIDPNGEFAAIFIKRIPSAPWAFYIRGKAYSAATIKAAHVFLRLTEGDP